MAISSSTTIWSIDHAAEQIGVSHQTLRDWVASGKVKADVFLNRKQPCFTYEAITRIRESRTNGKRD